MAIFNRLNYQRVRHISTSSEPCKRNSGRPSPQTTGTSGTSRRSPRNTGEKNATRRAPWRGSGQPRTSSCGKNQYQNDSEWRFCSMCDELWCLKWSMWSIFWVLQYKFDCSPKSADFFACSWVLALVPPAASIHCDLFHPRIIHLPIESLKPSRPVPEEKNAKRC